MNKKIVLPVVVSLAGTALAVFIATAKPAPEAQLPPVAEPARVEVIALQPQAERIPVYSQASVQAKRQIDLVAQVSGVIARVDEQFAAGGRFTHGQLLLSVDQRDYEIAVVRVQAQLAQAQAEYAQESGRSRQARAEWRDLGSAQANALFLREPQLAAAKAQVSAAKADLQRAELDLARASIQAPFSGRIVEVHVNLGQYITAGTRLATVYDSSSLEVALPINRRDLALLDLDQIMKVRLQTEFAGEPMWDASIKRSAAKFDEATRQLALYAEIDHSENALAMPRIGQFLSARIEGVMLENVYSIPPRALRAGGEIWSLDAQQKLQKHPAEVLARTNGVLKLRLETSEPLRVITSYLAAPQSGMPLALVDSAL